MKNILDCVQKRKLHISCEYNLHPFEVVGRYRDPQLQVDVN